MLFALLARGVEMEDKVKIRCPACIKIFREKYSKVRDGAQLNCLNCNKLITLNRETEDPFLRKARPRRPCQPSRVARTAQDFRCRRQLAPLQGPVDVPQRIEALFTLYFLALLIQALIERELRQAMQRERLKELPIYPEQRACRRPTPPNRSCGCLTARSPTW